jgi:uncharacterized protein YlzI (FlbEa/FlbD family)
MLLVFTGRNNERVYLLAENIEIIYTVTNKEGEEETGICFKSGNLFIVKEKTRDVFRAVRMVLPVVWE